MDSRISDYFDSITIFGKFFGYEMSVLIIALGLVLLVICGILLVVGLAIIGVRTLMIKRPHTILRFFITTNDVAFSTNKVLRKEEKKPFIKLFIWLISVSFILLVIVGLAYDMVSTKQEASSIRTDLVIKVANSENTKLIKIEDFLTDSISLNTISVTTFSYGGKDYLDKKVLYIDSSSLGKSYTGNTGLLKPDKGVLTALEKEFLPYHPYTSATSMRGQSLLDVDFIYIVSQDEEDED